MGNLLEDFSTDCLKREIRRREDEAKERFKKTQRKLQEWLCASAKSSDLIKGHLTSTSGKSKVEEFLNGHDDCYVVEVTISYHNGSLD